MFLGTVNPTLPWKQGIQAHDFHYSSFQKYIVTPYYVPFFFFLECDDVNVRLVKDDENIHLPGVINTDDPRTGSRGEMGRDHRCSG